MAQNANYRRTRYLVATKFQLRYVGLVLMLVFLTGILCSYVVYYTMMLGMGDKLANVYPQGRLLSIVRTVNMRLFLGLILIAPLVAAIGIFASHKIAGPIYRIERFLDDMVKGDYSSILTLRKNDELIPLASAINRVLDSLKGTVRGERAHLEKAAILLDNLKMVAGSETISRPMLEESVDKLSEEMGQMNRELDKYKI